MQNTTDTIQMYKCLLDHGHITEKMEMEQITPIVEKCLKAFYKNKTLGYISQWVSIYPDQCEMIAR